MTTDRLVIQTIYCDNVTDGRACTESWDESGSTAKQIRESVKLFGWSVGLHGGRDLCPKHDRLIGSEVAGD